MTAAAIEVDLLPCPGCGRDSTRVIGGPGTAGGPKYWAGCDYCNWRTWGDTRAEAITAWNTRQPTTPTTGEDDVERVARTLHGNLFATITDWRDEICDWDELPDHARNAFLHTARAALAAISPTTEDAEKRALVEALRSLIDECSVKLGDPRGVSIYAIENARQALASIGERS